MTMTLSPLLGTIDVARADAPLEPSDAAAVGQAPSYSQSLAGLPDPAGRVTLATAMDRPAVA